MLADGEEQIIAARGIKQNNVAPKIHIMVC
jgi:hypothetical protein